jgi:glycosyltransferase involved in cell wall biosynthesis
MVIIEAMAMGLPIMSTPVGIAPEVVGDGTGVLAASARVEDLEQALTRLLDARGRWPDMGAAARERVATFTAARMADDHRRLYERLLTQRGAT